MEEKKVRDVVIIGAGLTGLTAGYYLKKKNLDVVLLDQNNQPGGVIRTHTENGYLMESGPNTAVLGTEEAVDLFEELREEVSVEIANTKANKRYVLKNNEWHALPSGPISGIRTSLFTAKDKIRLLGEPFRKPGKNPHESLASLVKRRLGQSFLDYAVDPFVLGIYSGDPEYLVPKYALPKLYNLEQQYGSFIGGAIKKKKENKHVPPSKATREVFSIKGGLQHLTDTLSDKIGADHFCFEIRNVTVIPKNGMFEVQYLREGKRVTVSAKKVITTTGGHALPELLPFLTEKEKDSFSSLPYAKVVALNIGFKNWEGFPPDGFGGLIPSKENKTMLGVLFMSTLFENRAPDKAELFTVFMGGYRKPWVYDYSDEKIVDILKNEFSSVMNLPSFNPDLLKIHRYAHAIPQYGADMGERLKIIDNLESGYPGLYLGGNVREGIGMADRIKQGKRLALDVTSENGA